MFRIEALPARSFAHYFAMTDEALAEAGGCRVVADATPGYPCRVSLEEARVGERLILVNHHHLVARSPYSASHAVYVREGAVEAAPEPGAVPAILLTRLLSVRAFDERAFMRDGDVIEGRDLAPRLEAMLADEAIAFVDVHFAKRGCFGARARRA